MTATAPAAPAKVYFTNLRTHARESQLDKLKRLIRHAGIEQIDFENKFVAIKIHFGELGNLSFLRPNYARAVADVVKELGDVGNDIQVYDGRLFAVINCSHKVEVMDAYTARRITQIDIPNCRYIRFKGKYAYVSAYVGPVAMDPNAQKGAVFKVDLDTYKIVGQVTVGYQPDELAIIGGRAYVANSGGYRAPNYDSTVSVIELETMRQMYKIDVAINLSRIKADAYGNLWVSSRGNYDDVPSNLYRLEPNGGRYQVAEAMNIPASNMIISGDSLYVYSVEYSNQTSKNTVTYLSLIHI